jgi:hypothetical protein
MGGRGEATLRVRNEEEKIPDKGPRPKTTQRAGLLLKKCALLLLIVLAGHHSVLKKVSAHAAATRYAHDKTLNHGSHAHLRQGLDPSTT